MKFSIVTAVFNREDTISDALASVQGQSYGAVEHLIQDGGSTDGTLDLIRARATDTTLLVSEPDSGIYDALNKGISRASGDVVGLMHSDDFFAHDRVLERVAEILQDRDIDGVYGDLDYVSATNTRKVVRQWRSGSYSRDKLRWGWMPPHPTLFLRREVFETWGLYDPEFQIAADYDAVLRFLWKGHVNLAYLPEVLVKMRVGGASNRSLRHILRKSREDYQALRRNGVGGAGVLFAKNASKLRQFMIKERQAA